MKDLIKLIKKARFIFVCGNGGSSATAEHFTNDLFSRGYKAICLNSNVSIMTMIANDFGYEFIFSEQLARYASSKDLLITISCSGTSANIEEAERIARIMGMKIYNFETFKKNYKGMLNEVTFIDYADLEDKHIQFAHAIAKAL